MPELTTEAVAAQHIGRRTRQEDAMIAQFPHGGPGLAVLSDGMGGHNDGDLASRILVSEMFGELFLAAARPPDPRDETAQSFLTQRFIGALEGANKRLQQHIGAGCISDDTGGTLLSVTVDAGQLRWISVGDSPLYLCRDGGIRRLNELHSMSTQLDLMVRNGAMTAQTARTHPHRHCLTSALTGRSIPRIDCPKTSVALEPGDVILLASDGLNVLEDARIGALTHQARPKGSAAIAQTLLDAVRLEDTPDQDNVSLIAIRIDSAEPAPEQRRTPPHRTRRNTLAGALRRLWPNGLGGLRATARRARP